jgi:hypothetical protein
VPVQRNTFYEPVRVWEGDVPPGPPGFPTRPGLLEGNLATA